MRAITSNESVDAIPSVPLFRKDATYTRLRQRKLYKDFNIDKNSALFVQGVP